MAINIPLRKTFRTMYWVNNVSLTGALVWSIKSRDVVRKTFQDSVIDPTVVVDLFTFPSVFDVEKPPDDQLVHNLHSK